MESVALAVVVNPHRPQGLDDLLRALGERADAAVIEPGDANNLADAFRGAACQADVVAAIGGDGTQRTAASALQGTDAALAVVPGGTVNLLARVLRIDSIEDAAAAIVGGRRRVLDLGRVDDEVFVLNASTGFDAAVIERVDDQAKRWGRLGYLASGLRTLRGHRPQHVEVTVDGVQLFADRAMTVMVANVGQRGSADFTVAPGSAPDDGVLDVLIQRCDTAGTMARALWALARGRRPDPADVVVAQGAVIDVRWRRQVPSQHDGDAYGSVASSQYRVEPASLEVCVPVTD